MRVQIQGAVGPAQYVGDSDRGMDRWAVDGLTAGRNRIRDWKGKLHVLEARGRSTVPGAGVVIFRLPSPD